MKKSCVTKILSFLVINVLLFSFTCMDVVGKRMLATNEYTLVVEGFDWGPAVNKVILELDSPITTVDFKNFMVSVERTHTCVEIPSNQVKGERTVVYAYPSDNKGNRVKEGTFITLVLAVSPNLPLSSPFQYSQKEGCKGNKWVDYKMSITEIKSNKVWNKQKNKLMPLVDEFDLLGKFNYGEGKLLTYASFTPKNKSTKSPLIIWLHGGGEGGTDFTTGHTGKRMFLKLVRLP